MRSIRRKLLKWYDENKRDLPWRHTKDPYSIWVSEIMAQQTRIDTVLKYYGRFIERFPDIESLADAEEDDVMSMWSGLGYYRRARLLHKGVKEARSQYGAQVPQDPKARLSLPGIGRYTAGAIGSIAFDQAEPIVDGNVARVLSRLFVVEDEIRSKSAEKEFWRLAEQLVSAGKRPGDFNQSLMEFGALHCTPRSPKCSTCPLKNDCGAYAEGRTDTLPTIKPKKKAKEQALTAVVASKTGSLVLCRSKDSLYGGLWNLPLLEGHLSAAEAKHELKTLGIHARVKVDYCEVQHLLSHRKLMVRVFQATHASLSRQTSKSKLTDRNNLDALGVSTLTRKILCKLN